jgi:hypothetical protein
MATITPRHREIARFMTPTKIAGRRKEGAKGDRKGKIKIIDALRKVHHTPVHH